MGRGKKYYRRGYFAKLLIQKLRSDLIVENFIYGMKKIKKVR
jgi:hypothetical protein